MAGLLGDCSELCRAPRQTESGVQLADPPIDILGSVGTTLADFSQVVRRLRDTHQRVSDRQLKLPATNELLCLIFP